MSDTSTNLILPYLAAGQAQKHVSVNEGLRKLDALVQLSAVSASTSAEPGSPGDGEVYIVPSGKSGTNWAGFSDWALAYYRDGAWEQVSPREGWLAFVKDADQLVYYTGSGWSLFPATQALSVSASDRVLGRASSGAGAAEEITFTDAAQALCDDADAAAMRATLGALGQIKVGVVTRDLTAASGAVDYTGMGFDPRLVLVFSAGLNNPAASWGVIDSSNSRCVYQDYTGNCNVQNSDAVVANPAAGAVQEGVGALISDGFRLTWVKTGSPTGNFNVLYVAIGG